MKDKTNKKDQSKIYLMVFLFVFAISNIGLTQPFNFSQTGNQKRIEIPFTYHQNFILIEVKMFALLPMKFIFDTGAEHTILFKRQYADIMGVEYERRIPIVGADLSLELFALVARQVTLQVNGMPIMDKDILVLERDLFKLDEITGSQIDGIIGGEFFKNVIFHINYRKQKITLLPKSEFPKPGKGYKTIPINLKSNKPYTIAEVSLEDGRSMDLELLVDTGAGIPLLLHNNSNQNLGLPSNYITGKLGVGLGGMIKGYIGRVRSVKIGDIQFDQVITNFQDLPESVILDESKFRNGILGNQILSRFDIWFDYISEKMYLKPGRQLKKKFNMDRSGMIVFATGQNLNVYVVQDVIEGSPADKAGILVGDVIKTIQGLPAKVFSLNGIIRKLQKKQGKKIRLQLLRNNKTIRKTFKLRDLV
jgi:predicted aspartyl protease